MRLERLYKKMRKMVPLCVLAAGTFLHQSLTSDLALADWRTDLGTFRIGVVASGDEEKTKSQVEPFRLAISEALGMEVEIFTASSYKALIEAHIASRIEYSVLSSAAFSAGWQQCQCIEPIALPLAADQSNAYKAVLISGPKGPAKLEAVNPARVVTPKIDALGGFAFAAYELRKTAKLDLPVNSDEPAMNSDQSVNVFLDSKDSVLLGWSSLTGDPSIGYTRGTLRTIAERNGGKAVNYKIIWKSSDIPNPPHVIKKTLPAEPKKIIRSTLLSMYSGDPVAYDAIEPVFGGGFATAKHQQYEKMIEFVSEVAELTPLTAVAKEKK